MTVPGSFLRFLAQSCWIGISSCVPGPIETDVRDLGGEVSFLPLTARPSRVSLGQLRPGQAARTSLRFDNTSRSPCVVSRVEASCPCIAAEPRSFSVGPGRSATISIEYDPDESPGFRGGLTVQVTAHEPSGAVVGRVGVELVVKETCED
ncbi:MAG: DUF1573 domain-containing protein [Isosphaeraceae bacterium]